MSTIQQDNPVIRLSFGRLATFLSRCRWKPALAAANLDVELGTHTLRRSQVALLIADRLCHTSVRTVLDVYDHLYEGADGAAAERLEAHITTRSRPDGASEVVRGLW
jgi:hypothetical protein